MFKDGNQSAVDFLITLVHSLPSGNSVLYFIMKNACEDEYVSYCCYYSKVNSGKGQRILKINGSIDRYDYAIKLKQYLCIQCSLIHHGIWMI